MEQDIEIYRHSLAHILAYAVKTLYPDVKLGIGPSVENGFYYDFDLDDTISEDDFERMEKEMDKIIKEGLSFEKEEIEIARAKEVFANQPLKIEILSDLAKSGTKRVTIYQLGEFVDLCQGPHVDNSADLKSVSYKLTRVAGAYWKGNEKNQQLQRLYGIAFDTQEELIKYLENLEQSKKRDHRLLGRKLGLFTFHKEAPGMPFWHPNGVVLFNELVNRWRQIQTNYGYGELKLPNLLSIELWKKSGHYDHYKDGMFFTDNDGINLALRPMDCPGAILVYKEKIRSYNDLPIKWSELGTVFRNEQSGEIHGMMRVQQITQDDAHVFVAEEQIQEQVTEVLQIMNEIYAPFDMEREILLATKPDDAMGSDEVWDKAERALRQALEVSGTKYGIKEKDGAFYGPKIDIHVKDAMGRSWQTGTIQLDFFMPEKFNLEYIASDGTKKRPVMIHRALMGSLERFVGIITEHYGGAFPVWLAPVQVKVLPVSEKHKEYAQGIIMDLVNKGPRTILDASNETLSRRIRIAEIEKVPYIIVVGDKEIESKKVNVRIRDTKDKKIFTLDELIEEIAKG